VVEVTCDRCKKTYEAPPPRSPSAQEDLLASVSGIFIDASDLQLGHIVYEDLCPRCRKRVTSLVSDIKLCQETDDAEAQPPAESPRDGEDESTHRPQEGDGFNPALEERQ
jgi:hypothetical protein